MKKLVTVCCFCFLAVCFAEPYAIDWWTADGGGGASQSGNYTLSGTLGQPDAGVMQAESYTLSGGFWSGHSQSQPGFQILLPLVVK